MLKMSSQIETIVNAYKTLSKIPTIAGGRLNNVGNKITSVQSVRNIDKGKNSKYVYSYALDDNLNVISKTDYGVDISNELLSAVSPKETFKAVIREEKDNKDTKKQYLEIWSLNAGLTNCIDLTALDIHGDVYADSEFGSLDWSQDETAVVYVAERKLKKYEPYIKRNKAEDASKSGGGDPAPKKGEEYVYRQDWGEQLVGKHLSVVVVCKIESETFSVLEGLPESCCPGQIETIVNAYKTLSKIPTIAGGRLNNVGNKITSVQSVRNIDKGKNSKYVYSYALDDNLNVISKTDYGVDISNELLSAVSPKETFKAVIREEKDNKDTKKQYLEIWSLNAGLTNCIDLTALDIHGDVYADSEFGSLDWSQDETAVVYVAERKLKKYEPYIKRNKAEDASKSGGGDPAPKKGEEYVYRQDWGEQLVGKHLSVVVVCKIESETFSVLEGLPESCCPGQVRFAPDGKSVVGVAWETEPRRLGLIFCTNRPSFIFDLTLEGHLSKLSSEGKAVRSPRVRPDGDLVWLQRAAGGPHHACHALVIKKKTQSEATPIIDIVQTGIATSQGKSFYGLYNQGLPKNCFTKDGSKVVFSTPSVCDVKTYVVDVDSGKISEISSPDARQGSLSVLDIKNDVILASFSDMRTPAQLYVGKLSKEGEVKWNVVSETVKVPESLASSTVHYLSHKHDNSDDAVKTFTSLYLEPKSSDKLPLIVWPHGGPHSGYVNAYSLETAFYNMLGFAVLQINYRGSTGAGEDSVTFLPKRVGSADVADCKLATDDAITNFNVDSKKISLAGGSHGGFLVAHLSGQYPDTYYAVVSRNPVIDVASMFNSSDIPDWCAVEAGFPFTEKGQPSEDELLALRRCSPLVHVHKVKAPTAFMLGKGDKRVPHYQGLEMARRLKANGVQTRVYMYDDNHSLSSLPHEMDQLINSASWLLEHLP